MRFSEFHDKALPSSWAARFGDLKLDNDMLLYNDMLL